MLASYLDNTSALKMEAICFSETSINVNQTTWLYIPEEKVFKIAALRISNHTSCSLSQGILQQCFTIPYKFPQHNPKPTFVINSKFLVRHYVVSAVIQLYKGKAIPERGCGGP
jgi:hypothetical protein